jgi:hypothetical protein
MGPLRSAFGVVVTVLLLTAAAGPVEAQTFTFERTVPAPPVVTLDVSTQRGAITISTGDDDHVRVTGHVTVRSGFNVPVNARELAQTTANRPPIEQAGTTLRLRAPADPQLRAAVTVAYDVEVPPRTTVVAVSDSGAVHVERVAGTVSIKTQSGAITATALGGAVTIESGSGDVSLTGASGAVNVKTSSSGQVQVTGSPRAPWTIDTGSSAIDVTFGADASATIDATSRSSAVKITPALVSGTNEPRHVAGDLNGGGPTVTLTSRSGTITIGRR